MERFVADRIIFCQSRIADRGLYSSSVKGVIDAAEIRINGGIVVERREAEEGKTHVHNRNPECM